MVRVYTRENPEMLNKNKGSRRLQRISSPPWEFRPENKITWLPVITQQENGLGLI